MLNAVYAGISLQPINGVFSMAVSSVLSPQYAVLFIVNILVLIVLPLFKLILLKLEDFISCSSLAIGN